MLKKSDENPKMNSIDMLEPLIPGGNDDKYRTMKPMQYPDILDHAQHALDYDTRMKVSCKMEKISKYLQARSEPLEIKVTNINGEYHVRLLDEGKLHSEMACKEKQDIGYCTHEMLRWYDKMGGVSTMAEASRNRQKNLTPIGKVRKIK